jgi:SAM-dependent methyltransferase
MVNDIVENRRRIALGSKLKLARLALRENGALWCVLLLIYYVASTVSHRAFSSMDRLRRTRNLPGMNSAALNKEIWEAWNWSAAGEEWSQSAEWKESLVRCILERYVPDDCTVLEIGPGAGRWTEYLLRRAREYIGIDISSACVAHCRERFAQDSRARFSVGSGVDLADVATDGIDAIWSFDVFVHINRGEVEGYVREFARVLRAGGVAIIHHGALAGAAGGWRSNLTAAGMQDIVRGNGLVADDPVSHWVDGATVHHLAYGDVISVIRRPKNV